ncbi:hypothetical protein OL548_28465 [Lysinibacillus sp. MHQ-1]|nr:hypothetical protein OL548_28465 [Lysinibacillus sp. MHQ-1]
MVDHVINTHIPIGDGVLHAQNMQYAPASTVIGSLLLNALFSEVIEEIAKTSTELPIFVSNNVDSDWSHNEIMIANYQDRIDFT